MGGVMGVALALGSAGPVVFDDEYAVLCGAIFICLLLCSIFTLAGLISRSAHCDGQEHAGSSAEGLPAFGANTFRSCTCCPGGISGGLCAARMSAARMSADRGASAGAALHKARTTTATTTTTTTNSRPAGGRRQGSQQAATAAHHSAPVLAARGSVDRGGHAAAPAAAPPTDPRDGLRHRSTIARYSSGADYPDPALERCERSDSLGAAALVALRYSCTNTSSSFTHAKQSASGQAQHQQAAGHHHRAISAPIPLADNRTAAAAAAAEATPSGLTPFQSTSSNAAATLLAARGSGSQFSRASDADSEASHVRRSNSYSYSNGNGNGNVDTGFLQRLEEALSSGALRPDQATRLLRDVGFDLDQLLVEELGAK